MANIKIEDESIKDTLDIPDVDSTDIKKVEKFENNTGYKLIYKASSLEELEKEYQDFLATPIDHRLISDDKSIELFGMSNEEHYNRLKSDFLSNQESGIIKSNDNERTDLSRVEPRPLHKQAEEWCKANLKYMVIPTYSLTDLESQWYKWNTMTVDHKRLSDSKSIELFGCTNQETYEKIKSELNGNKYIETIEVSADPEDLIPDEYDTVLESTMVIPIVISRKLSMEEYEKHVESVCKNYDKDVKQASKDFLRIFTNTFDTIIDNIEPGKSDKYKKTVTGLTFITFPPAYFISVSIKAMIHFMRYEQSDTPMHIKEYMLSSRKKLEKKLDKTSDKEEIDKLKIKIEFCNKCLSRVEKELDKKPYVTIRGKKVPISNYNKVKKEQTSANNIEKCIELIYEYNEDTIVNKLSSINKINTELDNINDGISQQFDDIVDLPMLSPEDMINKGVFSDSNYYSNNPDNKYLDEDKKIKTNMWFDDYILSSKGIISSMREEYTRLWINKLNNLYLDYKEILESKEQDIINSRKQSILELGWNPEIPFTLSNRIKATNYRRKEFSTVYENVHITDLRPFIKNVESLSDNVLLESENNNLYPIYIVLSSTGSLFSKVTTKITKSIYTHASIGLDESLEYLYSYDLAKDGFNFDSIKQNLKDMQIVVYTVFVNKKSYQKLQQKLNYFIANKDKTHYSIRNLFGIMKNKSINRGDDMICSQFVDSMLKYINVDITNKDSGLVTPADFTKVTDMRLYKVYTGNSTEYSKDKIKSVISNLQKKVKFIKESNINIINESQYIDCLYENMNDLNTLIYLNENSNILTGKRLEIYENYIKPMLQISICEIKEFPVQFDDQGNLLIKNMKKIDFESEYSQSHKLLLLYDKSNNMEGMKYELSKLWFLNLLVEKKVYSNLSNKDKKELYKVRARILNDFNKYLTIVSSNDKEFNFTEYYDNTPFSDAIIKVNNSTMKHGGKLVKNLAKLLM